MFSEPLKIYGLQGMDHFSVRSRRKLPLLLDASDPWWDLTNLVSNFLMLMGGGGVECQVAVDKLEWDGLSLLLLCWALHTYWSLQKDCQELGIWFPPVPLSQKIETLLKQPCVTAEVSVEMSNNLMGRACSCIHRELPPPPKYLKEN